VAILSAFLGANHDEAIADEIVPVVVEFFTHWYYDLCFSIVLAHVFDEFVEEVVVSMSVPSLVLVGGRVGLL
jgi:hypothetical protein